jgi:hypothetical protein
MQGGHQASARSSRRPSARHDRALGAESDGPAMDGARRHVAQRPARRTSPCRLRTRESRAGSGFRCSDSAPENKVHRGRRIKCRLGSECAQQTMSIHQLNPRLLTSDHARSGSTWRQVCLEATHLVVGGHRSPGREFHKEDRQGLLSAASLAPLAREAHDIDRPFNIVHAGAFEVSTRSREATRGRGRQRAAT